MEKSFENILRRMHEMKREFREPESVAMSNEYWTQLRNDSGVLREDPTSSGLKVFGLDVFIDPKLGPNEFEIKWRK